MSDFFNVLLNNTTDADKLLDRAEAANVDVRLDDKGAIKWHALKKTPEAQKVVNDLLKIAKTNKKLVAYTIEKRGNPAVFNPTTPGDVARNLLPSSGGGLGGMAGLTALDAVAPEAGIPLQLAVGALSGMAGADLNKETPLSGLITGGIAGGTQAGLKGALKGAQKVRAFVGRPGVLDRRMMANIGKVIKDTIESYLPNAASKIIDDVADFGKPGKNTVVRVLNGPEANQELQKHYQDTLKTVIGEVEKDSQSKADQLASQFKAKHGYFPSQPKTKLKASKQMLKDLSNWEEARDDARKIGPEMRKAFDDIAATTRGSYDTDNELKHSYTAIKGVQNKTQLNDKINELINETDKSGQLANLLNKARDDYSKFSGFQDFVNQDHVMDKKGQFFNAQTLQKAVDGNTNPSIRFIQRRVKDAFDPLVDAVRRGAEPFDKAGKPQVSDNPLWNEQGGLRAGGAVPGLGRIFTHLPSPKMFGHYIGDTKVTPQGIGKLPQLLNMLATKFQETPDKQGPE